MNKSITIGILIFLVIVLSVFSAYLDVASPVTIQGQSGTTAHVNFNIMNTNSTYSVALTSSSFSFNTAKFIDNDGDSSVISFSSPGTIAPLSSANVIATAVISSKMDEGTYSADVLVSNGTFNDTFILQLVINPDICDEGITGDLSLSDWDLKKNPETDQKDEYYPGDKIVVQSIKVSNDGSDEITDVVVEVSLYDLTEGDELDSIRSDNFNLKSDKETNVDDLELYVPYDADESDDFAIFVKVYEDGNEDENCRYESYSVDVKRRSRDMQIDFTNINPTTAKCGDYVDFTANVKNIGTKDDSSIYFKIQDPALKITGQTAVFSLDSDDETSKTVRIQLPQDLTAGLYSIEAVVVYSGTTPRSAFGNLTVTCEPKNTAPIANAGITQTIETNNIVTLNGASSSDAENDQLTYLWTQLSGLQVQLSNPTSAITTFTPTASDTYVFRLDVSDGKLTSSATTTVTVTQSSITGDVTYQPTGLFDSMSQNPLQSVAFGLVIIVLLLVISYLVKLIFFPKKKVPQMPLHSGPKPELPEFPE
ncbi:MAG: putative S-layer protein [Nanoarchaeota archaeon]|nr:putative S-layer protein [Nanoarchaeota archaeon]MBU0962758.1 putative S-layer protein [Nanoarchaeota archaeon]